MKKLLARILALTLALTLFGCAEKTPAQSGPAPAATGTDSPAQTGTAKPEDAVNWGYDVELQSEETQFTADDGTVIATKKTELPHLVLKSEDDAAGSEAPTDMQAVCDAFNNGVSAPVPWGNDIDIETEAREQYEWKKQEGIEFSELADWLEIEGVYRRGDLLSVLARGYINLGGAHPDWYLQSWNFDLAAGAFVTPVSLSGEPDALRTAIADKIVTEVYNSEWYEGYYDDFPSIVGDREDFDAYFNENGMTVYFQEYEIASHVMGLPEFTIPYAELSRFLSADGARLLALSAEDKAMGDYYEAEEMWYWTEGAMPVDETDVRYVRVEFNGDSWDAPFCRVDIPGVTTLAELRAWMRTRFSDALADERIDACTGGENPLLREIDGALYAQAAGRGDDMYIESVDFRAELNADGSGGRVIATIQWRDYDEVKEEWVLTETSEVEFPFEQTDGGARFTDFHTVR